MQRFTRQISRPVAALALLLGVGAAQAASFGTPEKLTDGTRNFQMSRNPGGTLAFDSAGRLHLVYWSGDSAATPSTPSYVHYQLRTPAGWSTRVQVDTPPGPAAHVGGRHPSLAILPDDSVLVVWHDHRHGTAANGYIDNVEIYADTRPSEGGFLASDIRLTETTAPGNNGDNGYLPRAIVLSDGRVAVSWYDFNDSFGISDLYIKYSDINGAFTPEPLASLRLTDLDQRTQTPAFSTPDIAADSTGAVHAIWADGFLDPGAIYFSTIPQPTSLMNGTVVVPSAGGYFDPPRLLVAPNDDLWILYTRRAGTESDVVIRRKPAASGAFDPEIVISASVGVRENAIDGQFDSTGLLHLAWLDRRAGSHVYYATYDPALSSMSGETAVTTTSSDWRSPAIALDEDDVPHIAFEEHTGPVSGDIWFVGPPPSHTSPSWSLYQ